VVLLLLLLPLLAPAGVIIPALLLGSAMQACRSRLVEQQLNLFI
jgi:hypothetical protein